MNGWIALLVILILIVAAVLSSKHSTKKHIENELVKKTGELIKEFGNVELQCVCFYTKEEENKKNAVLRYYLFERGAQYDSSKKVELLESGRRNEIEHEVQEAIRKMPYTINIEFSSKTYEEFFKYRIKDNKEINDKFAAEHIKSRIEKYDCNDLAFFYFAYPASDPADNGLPCYDFIVSSTREFQKPEKKWDLLFSCNCQNETEAIEQFEHILDLAGLNGKIPVVKKYMTYKSFYDMKNGPYMY